MTLEQLEKANSIKAEIDKKEERKAELKRQIELLKFKDYTRALSHCDVRFNNNSNSFKIYIDSESLIELLVGYIQEKEREIARLQYELKII